MAIDFRLAYRSPTEFVDLFPKTQFQAIDDVGNLFNTVILPVTIPASSDIIQTITITASAELANSVNRMYLSSGSQEDYGTITQYQVNENQLIITRLYGGSENDIEVNLVFFVKEDI